MKNHVRTTVLFILAALFLSGCMNQSSIQQGQIGISTSTATQQKNTDTIAVVKPVTSVPTTCQTTPVYQGGNDHSGFTDVPWVQATPSSTGIRGYLFFANTGASSTYRFLHTGGSYPDSSATKVLWKITNPQASNTIDIMGKQLSGGNETFRQSFPEAASPAGDYPTAVNVPTSGCWQLELKSGKLTASVVFWVTGS